VTLVLNSKEITPGFLPSEYPPINFFLKDGIALTGKTKTGGYCLFVSAQLVLQELKSSGNPSRAHHSQGYFKTGPGEYGEGDVFLGLTVPAVRKIAGKHQDLDLSEIAKLMDSHLHETRLCGLIILTNQYKKLKSDKEKKATFNFYMNQLKLGNINNWDLVDVSAPTIGEYLMDQTDAFTSLKKLSKSKSLWERRVSIIFTFAFIRKGEVALTFDVAEFLLDDDHDLIHKAVGWMLREAGKRDVMLLRSFLHENSHVMPRTMLRYSIEKLPEIERKKWLLDSKS
jgi:3-methyladenine DNA glycosylase AlkD